MTKQTMNLLLLGLAGAAAYFAYRFYQEKQEKETAQTVLANEEAADQLTGVDTTAPIAPAGLSPLQQKMQENIRQRYVGLWG